MPQRRVEITSRNGKEILCLLMREDDPLSPFLIRTGRAYTIGGIPFHELQTDSPTEGLLQAQEGELGTPDPSLL